MKRILTIAIYALVSMAAISAKTQDGAVIRGKVMDITHNEPAGWTTVALMTADSTVIAGATCEENGEYEIKCAPGDYILEASLIGYNSYSMEVSLRNGVTELETIFLEEDTQMLEGATITERVKLVEMKIDKVVMNVSQSAFAQGSNALDLMKKAPGVTIDKDGNVKLNGKSVSVWIDGRPSYVSGKALESLLRSTNSESIEKFELMEHPSAKYDAAGQGGIINIKTKKNILQGFNGSMGLGAGQMLFDDIDIAPWQQSYWLNLAYRGKKTNTFFSIYEGFYNSAVGIDNDMTLTANNFRQRGVSLLNNFYHNYNVKFGNDWFINDKNTLGFIAYVPGDYNTFNSVSSNTTQYIDGVPVTSSSAVVENGPNRSTQHSINLNYTHVFDEKRSAEMTTNLDYYHNMSDEENRQRDTMTLLTPDYLIEPLIVTKKVMTAENIYNIYSAKTDYQSVVWQKFFIESGLKWALSSTDNKSSETQTGIPERVSDFTYREHVAAAYFSMAGQLTPKLSLKAGLRGEYTNSFGDWKSSKTETKRDYFNLFPTLYLGFQPSANWRFSASYSRRISRPSYWQLNPTKTYLDAKTYTIGNPDILPQYSQEVALGIGLGQHLALNLAFNHTDNVVDQIPSYDPDGTQYLTWGNSRKQNIGIAAFSVSALPIGSWLQWTLGANGIYINSCDNMTGTTNNSLSAQAYTDFTFTLPRDWRISLDGYYSMPMQFGYFRIHRKWSTNLAVKKNLIDDKLTLTMKLNDIFRSDNQDLDIVDPTGGSHTTFLQTFYNQKITFDITWSFGKAQKPIKHRKVGNLEEMSRASGGGSSLGGGNN